MATKSVIQKKKVGGTPTTPSFKTSMHLTTLSLIRLVNPRKKQKTSLRSSQRLKRDTVNASSKKVLRISLQVLKMKTPTLQTRLDHTTVMAAMIQTTITWRERYLARPCKRGRRLSTAAFVLASMLSRIVLIKLTVDLISTTTSGRS